MSKTHDDEEDFNYYLETCREHMIVADYSFQKADAALKDLQTVMLKMLKFILNSDTSKKGDK